jgi:hypothetical protein
LDKPHILALAAETGFLLFKEQVPLKFKKEISAVQCKRKTFRLISLLTPVSFRWTVPLSVGCSRRHAFRWPEFDLALLKVRLLLLYTAGTQKTTLTFCTKQGK